jgi:Holliday junction DNA helicase RuvA
MIGKLTGTIEHIEAGQMMLDVNGVGYIVNASSRTLSRIGGIGDPTSVLIEMQVREDSMTLFGFCDRIEQDWFKLLTSVQGVGAKAGLSILASCPPERLALVIASGDKAAVQAADGVGPKLATRVVTELKDKAAKMDLSPKAINGSVGAPVDKSVNTDAQSSLTDTDNSVQNDAISALVALGYAKTDAYQAVLKARNDNIENVQDIIRSALKDLSA